MKIDCHLDTVQGKVYNTKNKEKDSKQLTEKSKSSTKEKQLFWKVKMSTIECQQQ